VGGAPANKLAKAPLALVRSTIANVPKPATINIRTMVIVFLGSKDIFFNGNLVGNLLSDDE
jgi:hypothetical protein